MKRIFYFCLAAVFLISGEAMAGKKWLAEKLGNDFAIAQSYLDDFGNLQPKEKVFLYYLFRAAVAGRDIYYDQRHRDAVKIREFVEDTLQHEKLPGSLKKRLETYAKYLWINNSQYHVRTGLKFAPPFTYEELQKALPGKYLAWLTESLFDSAAEPVLTNLTPKSAEGDILQASATNIYDKGIKLSEINALPSSWKGKLNVRFAKVNGAVVPQAYKIGGAYDKELSNIVYFLKKALPLASDLQKSSLEKLIRYYETGDEKIFKESGIDWLREAAPVDTINGFTETYMDPRQVVGSWEGMAYYTAKDPILQGFSDHVQYFEDHMPWRDAYKKKNIQSKPVATMINVAVAVGEGGPVTWSGINLPNYQDIRTKYGSKNVILQNMIEARNEVLLDMLIKEFYLPEYQSFMKKYYKTARKMLLYMHEVIGHGSGSADAKLGGKDPRDFIGKNYGAMEEARASLVAYHYINDPILTKIGAFKPEEQRDVMKALYLLEFQNQLIMLRNAKGEDVLREAHDRADQMIFEYVRKNFGGFEVVQEKGKYYVRITNPEKIHEGASQLLKIIHEAKAKGDKKTVDSYLEKYGNHFNADWRDNVVQRAEAAKIPQLVAMTFPKLIPVLKNGEVVDVKIGAAENFMDQQLRFGRISKTKEVSEKNY